MGAGFKPAVHLADGDLVSRPGGARRAHGQLDGPPGQGSRMMDLLMFAIGAWLAGSGGFGLLRGRVLEGGMNNPKEYVQREAEPLNYWLTTLAYLGFGCAFLWQAVT